MKTLRIYSIIYFRILRCSLSEEPLYYARCVFTVSLVLMAGNLTHLLLEGVIPNQLGWASWALLFRVSLVIGMTFAAVIWLVMTILLVATVWHKYPFKDWPNNRAEIRSLLTPSR